MFDKTKASLALTATKAAEEIKAGAFDSAWALSCAIILAGIFVCLGLMIVAAAM